jgi:hypothetical protein
MINKTLIGIVLLFLVLSFSSGCAINRATATADPSFDPPSIKSMYVIKSPPDGRGINQLIANKLQSLGYSVTTGLATTSDADALVTYVDKWMWDMKTYMLELTITIRDPKTDFPLASGNSYHTSLTRKSPEEMIDEVITNIFKQKGK